MMPVELVCGLAIRLLVWIVVASVRFAARTLWSFLVDHPGLAFLLGAVSVNEQWIVSPWAPYGLLLLGGLAVVRFLSVHPPKEIARTVRREVRKTDRYTAAAGTVREKLRRKPAPDLPPPPRTVATDQTADWKGDALDDSGRRLFAYREAGWRGGIDQDGHPVDEHGTRITATDAAGERIVADVDAAIPMGPAAEVDA